MNPGEVWFHDSTLDIGLLIVKAQYRDYKYMEVRALCINRHSGAYYEIKTYTIQHDQLGHWKLWSI